MGPDLSRARLAALQELNRSSRHCGRQADTNKGAARHLRPGKGSLPSDVGSDRAALAEAIHVAVDSRCIRLAAQHLHARRGEERSVWSR